MDIFTTSGYFVCHKPFSGDAMTPIQLADFVGQHGQEEAAKRLGTSQAAISKALRSGRHIIVRSSPEGRFEAFELKAFPSSGYQVAPRPDLELIMSAFAGFADHLNRSVHPSSAAQASP